MKKIVLKLDHLHDDKDKQRAMKAVSTITGIDSIDMNMKEMKMTVIGAVDPITVVSKLRKTFSSTQILSVGPKEEPKKLEEQPKKEEVAVIPLKKEEEQLKIKEDEQLKIKEEEQLKIKEEEPAKKKEEQGKDQDQEALEKSEDEKTKKKMKELAEEQFIRELLVMNSQKPYYYPAHMNTHYYAQNSAEENPNSCSIF